ncbi:PRA1 family protein 2 isoform X1 [Oryzias latipes]
MAGVQPPPLRSLDDFLLCSARFAVPDVRDLDRWNHRMINNLLYYQTNYLLSALVLLLIVGYFQPFQMFVGVTVVSIAFLGFVFAAENQATVRRFRRNHPYVSVTAVLLATYLFMLALGGVAVFLFGIAFPVLRPHVPVGVTSAAVAFRRALQMFYLRDRGPPAPVRFWSVRAGSGLRLDQDHVTDGGSTPHTPSSGRSCDVTVGRSGLKRFEPPERVR